MNRINGLGVPGWVVETRAAEGNWSVGLRGGNAPKPQQTKGMVCRFVTDLPDEDGRTVASGLTSSAGALESGTMHALLDLARHPVIGHRGAARLVPENTLDSMQHAVGLGVDALEFDVRISADAVPIVLHDPTLNRTTDRAGPVGSVPLSEIADADAGYRFDPGGRSRFPWRGRGLRIPTVAQVLERFPAIPLLIELKTAEAAEPLRRLLGSMGAEGRVVIASFLEEALRPFLQEKGWRTGASRRGIIPLWLRSRIGFGRASGRYSVYAVPDFYNDRVHVPTARFVRMARAAGCPVHVWTVDESARAGVLWDQGVAGIISNRPDLILPERNRRYPGEAGRASGPGPP